MKAHKVVAVLCKKKNSRQRWRWRRRRRWKQHHVAVVSIQERETMTMCIGLGGYASTYNCHGMSGWQKAQYLVFKVLHSLQFNQYYNSYQIGTILEVLCVAQ